MNAELQAPETEAETTARLRAMFKIIVTDTPSPDPIMVWEHIRILHERAAAAGVDGILVLASFGEDPVTGVEIKERVQHFKIGDVKGMAETALELCKESHRNVYAPWAILRKGLARGQRGGKNDIKAVLALVVDQDADVGKDGITDLPMPAPYTVASSGANRQPAYILNRALTAKEAQPIAAALSAAVGGDAGTKDVAHVWRVAGTRNWLTASKLERGRRRMPELVGVAEAWTGELVDPEVLHKAATEAAAKRPAASAGGKPNGALAWAIGGTSPLQADDDLGVLAALNSIPNPDLGWEEWNRIGMAVWAATAGSDAGGVAFHAWSARSSKYDQQATEARWKHYSSSPPSKIGAGTLFYMASEARRGGGEQTADGAAPVDLWGVFPAPELPMGLLPPILERWAISQGETMGCDPGGLAVSALAVCAAAIPDSIGLKVKKFDDWTESARLWVALVGDPSAKKTPILSAAAAPIMRMDAQLVREYTAARAEFAALPKDEQTDPPKRVRLRIDDATIEAIQDILLDNSEGLLCLQDELSGWIGGIDKYGGNRGGQKDRGFFLRTYNGGEYPVDRITRRSGLIENASLSLLGGIQPAMIRTLAAEGVDDGLLQRMLFVLLKRASKGKDEPASPVAREYREMVEALNKLRPEPPSVFLHYEPTWLRFEQGAQAIREDLEQRHIDLMSLETVNKKLAAHIGKYDGLFARLCLVWHAVENYHINPLPPTIAESTAQRVRDFLHGYLLPHAFAFYAGVLGLSDDHDRLTAVAGFILAHKLEKATVRDVQRGDRTMRGLKRHETDRIFQQLEALGWLKETPGARATDPSWWLVNPAVHSLYAARGKDEAERRSRTHAEIVAMLKKATPG